jgi:glutamyl-tRNA synthetase
MLSLWLIRTFMTTTTRPVRTRFAPSPTGGLHLGGVRTALFTYLFAKQHKGTFVLRIEDTDQTRFVPGAEEYILETLQWCGIEPDESIVKPGAFAPYRQSERKPIYKKYALQLIASGHAYYAFDTAEELEAMREKLRSPENPNPQYDAKVRMQMKNSLSLSAAAVDELLQKNTPHVIRFKMPTDMQVVLQDMIRHEVHFDTNLLDDKVLLKADEMPTYHLAVVVDDYLMQITHAFRGEEWLPSAPIHVLLWDALGWKNAMPQWAHLPLILKPDGHGKLSKRDGERLGFPVFSMDWTDNKTGETSKGFKEQGFLPEAFINILALLGWNDGTGKEIFTKEELINQFDMSRVHHNGAKFDFEKAKWFNAEYIKLSTGDYLLPMVKAICVQNNLPIADDAKLLMLIDLIKERCVTLNDFPTQLAYFYNAPTSIDTESILPKWSIEKANFFEAFIAKMQNVPNASVTEIETIFKDLAIEKNIKVGELQLPFRIMLVGAKFGPGVFDIAYIIGAEATIARIQHALTLL